MAPQRGVKSGSSATATLAKLKAEKVRWVQLFYTDVFGGFNQVDVPTATLDEESFEAGIPKLDGSSVRGFREIYDSDMNLVPDPSTIATIPWNPEAGGTARFICDIRIGGSKEPYAHDPRWVARKTEQVLAAAGYDRSYWGPEVEFFVFDSIELLPSAAGSGTRGQAPATSSATQRHRGREGPSRDWSASRKGTTEHRRRTLCSLYARRCATSSPTTSILPWTPTTMRSRPRASRRSTSASTSSCRWPTTSRTFATSSGTSRPGTGRSPA